MLLLAPFGRSAAIKASTQAQLINLFTWHHHGLLEEFDLYLAEKLNSLL